MGMKLSSWLALVRTSQLLALLAAATMHCFLTIEVHKGRVFSKDMVILTALAFVLLGYSALAVILQNKRQRSNKKSWLTGFVVCDVVMCAVLLGIINMLARAGLPVHCARMTPKGDQPPPRGYTTILFSDEAAGHRGELDRFCGFERSYYTIANALIFTYIFTITATVLRIWERNYTKNTKVDELLESLERAEDINPKVVEFPSSRGESPRRYVPPAPSEGIITRNTSIRSNFTTATSATASHTGHHHPPNSMSRHQMARTRPQIPRRPLPARSSPTSSSPPSVNPNPGVGFTAVPLDDDDDSAAAALVADGMRHEPQLRQTHHRQPSRDQPQHHQPFPRMPMLSEEDQSADHALVSDGMRPSEPMLPPYHPGNRRMSGHGGEDNEMRLSGYVKGQTRAQDMKDSGRY